MQVIPYLNVNGQCEAAFKLYEQVLRFGTPWMINCDRAA